MQTNMETKHTSITLENATDAATRAYLNDLGGNRGFNMFRNLMNHVERPLLSVIMEHCKGNQSKAAKYLGINRATLRTKLKRHDLL